MVFTKRRTFFKPAGAARFFTAIATLLVLAAPAIGQTFTNNQYCTYTQGGWGAVPHGNNPAMLLYNNFPSVYPSGVPVGDNYDIREQCRRSKLPSGWRQTEGADHELH